MKALTRQRYHRRTRRAKYGKSQQKGNTALTLARLAADAGGLSNDARRKYELPWRRLLFRFSKLPRRRRPAVHHDSCQLDHEALNSHRTVLQETIRRDSKNYDAG